MSGSVKLPRRSGRNCGSSRTTQGRAQSVNAHNYCIVARRLLHRCLLQKNLAPKGNGSNASLPKKSACMQAKQGQRLTVSGLKGARDAATAATAGVMDDAPTPPAGPPPALLLPWSIEGNLTKLPVLVEDPRRSSAVGGKGGRGPAAVIVG